MQKGVAFLNAKKHLQSKVKQLKRNLKRYMDMYYSTNSGLVRRINYRPLEVCTGDIIKDIVSFDYHKRDQEYARNKAEFYRIKLGYKIQLLRFEIDYINRLINANVAMFMTKRELNRYKLMNKVESKIDYIVKPKCKPKFKVGQVVWFIADEETDDLTGLKISSTVKEAVIDSVNIGSYNYKTNYCITTTGRNWLLYPYESYIYETKEQAMRVFMKRMKK